MRRFFFFFFAIAIMLLCLFDCLWYHFVLRLRKAANEPRPAALPATGRDLPQRTEAEGRIVTESIIAKRLSGIPPCRFG
jgi:hypothetical protein